MAEKLWYLKRCDLFEKLSPETLSKLEMRSRARKFPRKTPIYLPADQAQSIFLLVSGRIKICHLTAEGKQSILAFIEPGELFGELALLEGSSLREEYAETVEASTIVMIPNDAVLQLMQDYSELTLGITKMIGLRRRRIERRLKNLLFLSNRDRLTHLLLELAEQYGEKSPEGILLSIKLSHQDLANIIGSTRETVTVVLGELQTQGLIQVGRRKITLLNPQRLADSVNESPPQPQGDRPGVSVNQGESSSY